MSDFIFGQPPPPPQNSNSSGSSNNNQNTNQNKRKPNSTGVLRKRTSNDIRHHPYRNGSISNQPTKQLPKSIPSLPNTPLVKANVITDVNDRYNLNRYPVQQQQKPVTSTVNIRSPADVIADLQRGLLNKATTGNQNNKQNNNNNIINNNSNSSPPKQKKKNKNKNKNKNKSKQATNNQTSEQKNEQRLQVAQQQQQQQQQLPQPLITSQRDTSMQSDNDETLELFPGIRIEIPHTTNEKLDINQKPTNEIPVINTIQAEEKPDHVSEAVATGGDDMDIDAVTEDFEDEETAFGKQAVSIPGTNIVLETEEDIQKWIEERKHNWPTRKRMEEKQKEKEENDKILKTLNSQNNKTGRTNHELTNCITENDQPKRNVRICKFFASTGKCRKGNSCKFSHVVSNDPSNQNNKNSESEDVNRRRNFVKLPNHKTCILHGVPVQIPQRFTPSLNKGKSLHNLMIESEIMQTENNKILLVLEKIVNSNLITNDWDTLKKKLNL